MLVAAWPPFLTGVIATALAPIGLGVVELGLGVSLFFLAAAVLSPLGGRFVARWGASIGLRVVNLGMAMLFVLLATISSVTQLLVLLTFAGALNALVQPSTNLLVRSRVSPAQLGTGLGIVQAAIPATLVASAALLPLVSGVAGWRCAYLVGAVCAVAGAALVPSSPATPRASSAPRTSATLPPRAAAGARNARVDARLLLLMLVAAFGASAALAISAFAATAASDVGLTPGAASAWVAIAGLACASVRIAAGVVAGRARTARAGVAVIAVLFALGLVGFLVLAFGGPGAVGPAMAVAYGFGWAWTGVLNLVVARISTDVASSTGLTQLGVFAGCAAGPIAFAMVSESLSFMAGWISCAVYLSLGLVLLLWLMRGAAAPSRDHARRKSFDAA